MARKKMFADNRTVADNQKEIPVTTATAPAPVPQPLATITLSQKRFLAVNMKSKTPLKGIFFDEKASVTLTWAQFLAMVEPALQPVIIQAAGVISTWAADELQAWETLFQTDSEAAIEELDTQMSTAALTAQIETDGEQADADVVANANQVAAEKAVGLAALKAVGGVTLAIVESVIAGLTAGAK
jgi:hypothetical protein